MLLLSLQPEVHKLIQSQKEVTLHQLVDLHELVKGLMYGQELNTGDGGGYFNFIFIQQCKCIIHLRLSQGKRLTRACA